MDALKHQIALPMAATFGFGLGVAHGWETTFRIWPRPCDASYRGPPDRALIPQSMEHSGVKTFRAAVHITVDRLMEICSLLTNTPAAATGRSAVATIGHELVGTTPRNGVHGELARFGPPRPLERTASAPAPGNASRPPWRAISRIPSHGGRATGIARRRPAATHVSPFTPTRSLTDSALRGIGGSRRFTQYRRIRGKVYPEHAHLRIDHPAPHRPDQFLLFDTNQPDPQHLHRHIIGLQ